ncbi:hypothetical protein [Pseudomonas syringae]|uniref:hypothetical protein n=1 Tax=Pseudomonas syringae TaxID=317 RepID=UPI000E3146DB|nr:hypothetical protein [Pseudomonas syringae]
MNEIKNTTMLWKRMNYSAQKGRVKKTAGLSQLKSSLSHSLRTVMKKELEFNPDLSRLNFIIHNNKMVPLDSLDLPARESLVSEILKRVESDVSRHDEITAFKNEKAKYSYKLKKILNNDKEPDDLKSLIKDLLDSPAAIPENIVNSLDKMNVKRLNDKKNCINKYIALHNQVVSASTNELHKNKTVVQECFFKFPARNKVNDVKPAHYLKIIHGFHKRYLPDYEVLACVFHGDEVTSETGLNNGVHPHIFISGKNSRTGNYDLVQSQLDLVNAYLKSKNEAPISNSSFKDAQKIGETYQQLVYEYTNKKLKEYNYLFQASVHEKTVEHKKKLEQIKQDEHKAKVQRNFNLLTKSIDEINAAKKMRKSLLLELDAARSEKATLIAESEELDSSKNNMSKEIVSLTKDKELIGTSIKKSSEHLASIEIDLKNKTSELKITTRKNSRLVADYEELQIKLERLKAAHSTVDLALRKSIHSLDVKIDKITHAMRMGDSTIQTYKAAKIDIINTIQYFGKHKRQDFLINLEADFADKGLDYSKVKLGMADNIKLWYSDTFTSTQIIEFDKTEKKEAEKSRKRRLSRPS